jgi:hypothetical protein
MAKIQNAVPNVENLAFHFLRPISVGNGLQTGDIDQPLTGDHPEGQRIRIRRSLLFAILKTHIGLDAPRWLARRCPEAKL